MKDPSSFAPLFDPWDRASGKHTVGHWMDFSVLKNVTQKNSSTFRHGNCTVQQPCIISLTEYFILYKHVSRHEISIDTVYIYMYKR